MLVRDVLPLMRDSNVVIVDDLDYDLWRGKTDEVSDDVGLLTLNVVELRFDNLRYEFVVYVDNRDDYFHDIELLLSDCMSCADESELDDLASYVKIMHASRQVSQIAGTGFAHAIGRR